MTTKRRPKSSRYRGSHTHGGGAKKKRRGAGHRGGRGNAGSGKRGDAKKPSFDTGLYGKHGFKVKNEKIETINVRDLEDTLTSYLAQGLFSKKGDSFECDLSKIGIKKLLASGKVTKKLHVIVKYASPLAVEKISSAGGSVVVTSAKAE